MSAPLVWSRQPRRGDEDTRGAAGAEEGLLLESELGGSGALRYAVLEEGGVEINGGDAVALSAMCAVVVCATSAGPLSTWKRFAL